MTLKSSERMFYYVSSLRRRNLLTSHQKLRLRYAIPSIITLAFVTSFLVTQYVKPTINTFNIAQILSLSSEQQRTPSDLANVTTPKIVPTDETLISQSQTREQKNSIQNSTKAGVTLASFYKSAIEEENGPQEITIKAGQTIAGQLQEMGIASDDAYDIVKALGKYYDPRKIKAGQSFEVEYDINGSSHKKFLKMTMPVSAAKQIVVYRDAQAFEAKEIEKKVKTYVSAGRASVKYSLYGSAAKANIPDEVIANMIKIFSWNVDFQRDIRSGDEIEILYETEKTEDGEHIGYGDILYARLVTGGQDLSLYRHKMKNGHIDYFDPKGNSIKRTLMKTPIDGARMSSGYGMRRHPVLGYNKMHKGVDFAAPTGTPIYAAGDGVVEKAGRLGSYGNYVRIRHNSKLKTAYAHMHRIKSGLRAGSRVKQGQVIGTVGTTGRSTGPHLHYEVLLNGKHTNPRGVNVPTGETLTGKELKRFKANKSNFDQRFAELTRPEKYASVKAEKTVQ